MATMKNLVKSFNDRKDRFRLVLLDKWQSGLYAVKVHDDVTGRWYVGFLRPHTICFADVSRIVRQDWQVPRNFKARDLLR